MGFVISDDTNEGKLNATFVILTYVANELL